MSRELSNNQEIIQVTAQRASSFDLLLLSQMFQHLHLPARPSLWTSLRSQLPAALAGAIAGAMGSQLGAPALANEAAPPLVERGEEDASPASQPASVPGEVADTDNEYLDPPTVDPYQKAEGFHPFRFTDPNGVEDSVQMPVLKCSGGSDYVYLPPFSLLEKPGAEADNPQRIIFNAVQVGDKIRVTYGVKIRSDEFKEKAREVLEKNGKKSHNIANYPISALRIRCGDLSGGQPLAETMVKVANTRENAFFSFEFSAADYETFQRLLQAGQLGFEWSFRGATVTNSSAEIATKGRVDVSAIQRSCFNSEQLAGKAPITRGEQEQFLREVSARLDTRITTEDPDDAEALSTVQKYVRADVLNQLLAKEQSIPLSELKGAHPEIEAALAEYLNPLITQLNEKLDKEHIEHKLDQSGSQSGVGGGLSATIPLPYVMIGANVNANKVWQALHQFEEQTGVKYIRSEQTQSYVPHSVSVRFLTQGRTTLELNENVRAMLRRSNESRHGWRNMGTLPSSFTFGTVKESVAKDQRVAEEAAERAKREAEEKALKDAEAKRLAPKPKPFSRNIDIEGFVDNEADSYDTELDSEGAKQITYNLRTSEVKISKDGKSADIDVTYEAVEHGGDRTVMFKTRTVKFSPGNGYKITGLAKDYTPLNLTITRVGPHRGQILDSKSFKDQPNVQGSAITGADLFGDGDGDDINNLAARNVHIELELMVAPEK